MARMPRLLVAASALIALCACSDASLEQYNERDYPELLVTNELRLPLENYTLSSDDRELVRTAENALIDECMERLSFPDWTPILPPPEYRHPGMAALRYGVTDATSVEKYAYDPLPTSSWTQPPETRWDSNNVGYAGALSGMEQVTAHPMMYNGHPRPVGGCEGEARTALSGDIAPIDDHPAIIRLGAETFIRSTNDPDVKQALDAWSACMAAAGYDYTSPLSPIAARAAVVADALVTHSEENVGKYVPFTPPTPTDDEIATAVTDVSCKAETNLVGVWFTVESAIQRELIDEYGDELATAFAEQDAMLDKARVALET